MNHHHKKSIFQTCFDAVVFGSGFAGYAAAMRLKQTDKRVLLVGQRSDMLWEAGRSFHPFAGHADDATWQSLVQELDERNGLRQPASTATPNSGGVWFDGAICEALATDQVMSQGLDVLYYASPAAVERESDAISAVIVATKSGWRRIVASQWIDATETASLLQLTQDDSATPLPLRQPDRLAVHLYLQHPNWASVASTTDISDLRATAWPSERVLSFTVPPAAAAQASWRLQAVDVLDELAKRMGEAIGLVSMSHWSIEPCPEYDATKSGVPPTPAAQNLPSNLVMASPASSQHAIHTLADRWQLGTAAVESLASQPVATTSPKLFDQPIAEPPTYRTIQADIVIAGAGTGGSVAAVAAAKADQSQLPSEPGQAPLKIIAIEPMAFPGGIGTGGGIHVYFFGVPGGLQHDIDQLTRQFMNRYRTTAGPGPLGDGPFNPWAKTIAFQTLFAQHHIELLLGATVVHTHTSQGKVQWAILATDQGLVRLEAQAWIDGTGDGDLCTLAGATFTLGREHDGLLHAYSQSSGFLRETQGRVRMAITNSDVGFCDPTDPEDFSRARLVGVRQKLLPQQENLGRTTYIAPAIGLRQGRQIDTQYILSFDDQVLRKRFDDAIGYSGCFYDNHATDYEFQSDDAMFWVWGLGQWRTHMAHEMSYRMIVPRGLENVWIASRCLGVSQEAHNACRMQRDIQRIGEAAGIAAVLALRNNTTATKLDTASLRTLLEQNGAFDKAPKGLEVDFGKATATDLLDNPDQPSQAETALTSLDQATSDVNLWWLYRHPQQIRRPVLDRLASNDPSVSWLAASIAAMWGEKTAEPRLLQAISNLEYGYPDWPAPGTKDVPGTEAPATPKPDGPMSNRRLVPRWLMAAALLRLCGTATCLPVLASLVDRPAHAVNTLTTVSLTLEKLATTLSPEYQYLARPILDQMGCAKLIGMYEHPQRNVGRDAQLAVAGKYDDPSYQPTRPTFGQTVDGNAIEDNTWQYHLALARARLAWNLAPQEGAAAYLQDPRVIVRRAMSQALEQQHNHPTPEHTPETPRESASV